MFIYVKKAHVDKIPGIKEFVLEFLKGGVAGGYLTKLGMIASSDTDYKAASDAANSLTAMTGADLK
jgi:phosphate transport system substrate-binding protein